jgi:hypothetical protein
MVPLTHFTEFPMHPRERVLGLARLAVEAGEPIPVDVIAEAEALGIYASALGQPSTSKIEQLRREKENNDGSSEFEISDGRGSRTISLAKYSGY